MVPILKNFLGRRGFLLAFLLWAAQGCENPYNGLGQNLDLVAPVLQVTSHRNLDFVAPDFTLSGTATDRVGVTSVEVTFLKSGEEDPEKYLAVLGENDAWSLSFSENPLATGEYEVTVLANDAAGNSSKSSKVTFALTVDASTPDLLITSPVLKPLANPAGTGLTQLDPQDFDNLAYFHNQTFQIRGALSEDFKAASVEVALVSWRDQVEVYRQVLSDGALPPGVEGSLYNFTLQVSEADLDSPAAPLLPDQPNYFQVLTKARDRAGNVQSLSLEYLCVFPQKDLPWGRVTSNQEGDLVGAGGTVSGNAFDDDGLSRVYSKILPAGETPADQDYLSWTTNEGLTNPGQTWTSKVFDRSETLPQIYTWTLKVPQPAGNYTLWLRVVDKGGKASFRYESLNFTVPDVNIPLVDLDARLVQGSTIKENASEHFMLQGTWSDNSGRIQSVSVTWVEGNQTAEAQVAGNRWSLSLGAFTLHDPSANFKPQNFKIVATDQEGNQGWARLFLVVDTDNTAPTVLSVVSTTQNPSSWNNFGAGSEISLRVLFSEPVTVAGTPRLTLETGAVDREAVYVYGSGTAALVFSYTVQPGDNAEDLDYTSPEALQAGEGRISDPSGNGANLSLPAPGSRGLLGDAGPLVIDTLVPAKPQVVEVTSASFRIDGGEPGAFVEYSLNNNPWVLYQGGATSFSPTGNDKITARQRDRAGNQSETEFFTIVNDLNRAVVLSVDSATPNGAYKAGDTVVILVDFSRNVVVETSGGRPRLGLNLGTTRYAVFTGGSGSSRLTFTYTLQSGDTAEDLDYTGSTALELNGSTIVDTRTAGAESAVVTLPAPGASESLGANRDLVVDTLSPRVVRVTSLSPDGYYNAGDILPLLVEFSEPVTVSAAGGNPLLLLETGTTDAPVSYTSGSGTRTLVFDYTVAPGQNTSKLDTLGLSVPAGSALLDRAGNRGDLTLPASPSSLSSQKDFRIDTQVPGVVSVTSPTPDGYYNEGKTIVIKMSLSENVVVSGTPQLVLNTLFPGPRYATYAYTGGPNGVTPGVTNTLYFTYIVAQGDSTSDLDFVAGESLVGGTITDQAGNLLQRTLPLVGSEASISGSKAIQVLTQPPLTPTVTGLLPGNYNSSQTFTITGTVGTVEYSLDGGAAWAGYTGPVTLNTSPGTETTYYVQARQTDLAGNRSPVSSSLRVVVDKLVPVAPQISGIATGMYNTNQTFTLTGEPGAQLAFTLNNGASWTAYTEAVILSNAQTYQVQARQTDTAGNQSPSTTLMTVIVNKTSPTIATFTSSTPNGSFNQNKVITLALSFQKNGVAEGVYVTGSPRIRLNSGGYAQFVSGSGSSVLTFNYLVGPGDTSSDLDYEDQSTALELNGGSIKDALGNGVDQTLPAVGLASSRSIVIDTTSPTVPMITGVVASGLYNSDKTIAFTGEPGAVFTYSLDNGGNLQTGNGVTTVTGLSTPVTYTLIVKQKDVAGNESAFSSPLSFTVDKGAPTLLRITSDSPAGIYKTGDSVALSLEFSEPVNLGTSGTLTLSTGKVLTLPSTGTYSSTFELDYTPGISGSEDTLGGLLNVASLSGSFKDPAGNTAVLTIPAGENLANKKSLKIDTQAPALVTRIPAQGAVNVLSGDPQWPGLQLTFSEPVYRESGTIEIQRTVPSLPLVMTVSQYNEYFSALTGMGNAPWIAAFKDAYQLSTNGVLTLGAVDTTPKYVLKYHRGLNDATLLPLFEALGYNKVQIPVDSTQVTGSGTKTITVKPAAGLPVGVEYFVTIPPTAFRDNVATNFPGLSGPGGYSFTTGPVAPPVIRVNKISANGYTGVTALTTTFRVDSETPGAQILYSLSSTVTTSDSGADYTEPRASEPSLAYTGAVTLGDETFPKGWKYYIQVQATRGDLSSSAVVGEKAYRTVLAASNKWFRGSNNSGGPTTAPGFPLRWEDNAVGYIRQGVLNGNTYYFTTWEIRDYVHFKALAGGNMTTQGVNGKTLEAGPASYGWGSGSNVNVYPGGYRFAAHASYESLADRRGAVDTWIYRED